jgi:hypothetical protein
LFSSMLLLLITSHSPSSAWPIGACPPETTQMVETSVVPNWLTKN